MDLPEAEHKRRLRKISGVYFSQHAFDRGRFSNSEREDLEYKLRRLDGKVFWDTQHENYQIRTSGYTLPFEVELHNTRPGHIAFVKSAFQPEAKVQPRFKRSRFQFLNVDESEMIVQCPQGHLKLCVTGLDPDDVFADAVSQCPRCGAQLEHRERSYRPKPGDPEHGEEQGDGVVVSP